MDNAKKLTDAQITSDMTALMATTDGSIPANIKLLIGQRGDEGSPKDVQWEITAITAGSQARWCPDGPLAPGQERYQWSMDRVSGVAVNPPAIKVVDDGYYLRVIGNAVALESWLKGQGWHSASAGSPNAVWLGTRCTGKMMLQRGDYRQCTLCGHVEADDE
jgi:hypothetical protein